MANVPFNGMKWVARCAAPFMLALSVHAASQDEQLIQSLLECSPKYFAQVRGMADFSSAGYVVTPKGRLVVTNYRDEVGPGSRSMGTRELQIGGLTVVGMYDLHRKANSFEMYDWGLLVKGEPTSLSQRLNGLLPVEKALDSDGFLGFARLEKTTIQTWPKWSTQKPMPSFQTVKYGEFELAAEITVADESLPGVTRIGCSLQGVFPPFVLRLRRPDID